MPDSWLKDFNSQNVLRFQCDPKDTFWSQQVIIDKTEPSPGLKQHQAAEKKH